MTRLAGISRTIVADWRLHIECVADAVELNAPIPEPTRVTQLANRMLKNGELKSYPGIRGVYRVVVPYAACIPFADEVVIQEAHPKAVLSHFSAMAAHGLTFDVPREMRFTILEGGERVPPGTSSSDWLDVPAAKCRKPLSLNDRKVVWNTTKSEWSFGVEVRMFGTHPVHITNLEKTLIDTLRSPKDCGGASQVFAAWSRGIDRADISQVIWMGEKFDQRVLKQRLGFVLEELGASHPTLDRWSNEAVRGSSAVLVSGRKFATAHSEKWCLSINATDAELGTLRG